MGQKMAASQFFFTPNRVIDSNGIADGATIEFFVAGTTTPQTAYSDINLTTAITNPLTVAAGAAVPAIYLDTALSYRVRFKDADGNVITGMDYDPYLGLSSDGISAGRRSIQARLDDRVAVADYATLSAGISGAIALGKPLYNFGTNTQTSWTVQTAVAPALVGGTIQGPATRVDFLKPSGGFVVSGITLDRWLSALKRELADSGTVVRALIEDSRFTNLTSTGINFECPTDGLMVRGNSFATNSGGYTLRIGTNDRTLEDTWQRCTVAFNRFEGVSGDGNSAAPYLVYGKDHLVIGNVTTGVTQLSTDPADEAWGGYSKPRWSVFAFNNISEVDGVNSTDVVGHTFKGPGRAAVGTSPNGYGSLVIGNVIREIGLHGTRGTGARAQTTEIQLAHNFIENPGRAGIIFDEPDGVLQSSIANRVHFTTANTANTVGFRFDTGGFGMRSLGDQSSGAETAFRMSGGGGAVDASGMVFDNGLISGGSFAYRFNSTALGDVNGLTIRNAVVQQGRLLQFDGGTATDVVVTDNHMLGDSTDFAGGTIPADIYIRHVFKFQSTNGNPTSVMPLKLPDNSSFVVKYTVSAMANDGGNRAMYVRQGVVYRDGGDATIQGGTFQTIGTDIETSAGWSCEPSVGGDTFVLRIIGAAATTINWKVQIEVIGVGA